MQSLLILMLDDLLRHEIAPSDIVLGCCLRKQMVGSNCAWKWLMPATGFCVSPSPSESELNLILFEWNIKAKIYKCVFMNRLTSNKKIFTYICSGGPESQSLLQNNLDVVVWTHTKIIMQKVQPVAGQKCLLCTTQSNQFRSESWIAATRF